MHDLPTVFQDILNGFMISLARLITNSSVADSEDIGAVPG
jgi:hypothetical protein